MNVQQPGAPGRPQPTSTTSAQTAKTFTDLAATSYGSEGAGWGSRATSQSRDKQAVLPNLVVSIKSDPVRWAAPYQRASRTLHAIAIPAGQRAAVRLGCRSPCSRLTCPEPQMIRT
jgi:hypothetical protein